MTGIAGILKKGKREDVDQMLKIISHRGRGGKKILEYPNSTIGIIWSTHNELYIKEQLLKNIFIDGPGCGQQASVEIIGDKILFYRDELGVSPLYYGKTNDGAICFASEVKALVNMTDNIYELQPGHTMSNMITQKYFELKTKKPELLDADKVASALRNRIERSVKKRIKSDSFGSWLSGGLDSSIIAAIARPWVKTLYSFTAGMKDAQDILYARQVASHIGSIHKEIMVSINDILYILPEVIYKLESFDALLVRSSILNYYAAKAASDYVSDVFSGECSDEFFAGYLYLKELPGNKLDEELIDIATRLHNTALQRVDRSAGAFGITAHVVFADPEVFDYALGIPAHLKLYNGIEKWILRQAASEMLPVTILNRTKAKFWEGSGIGTHLSDYASKKISEHDFTTERTLSNGWVLNTKEELMYYRLFREHFGNLRNLDWMGRSKANTKT